MVKVFYYHDRFPQSLFFLAFCLQKSTDITGAVMDITVCQLMTLELQIWNSLLYFF